MMTRMQGALVSTQLPAFTILKDGDGNAVDWELSNEADTQVARLVVRSAF